MSEKDDTQSRSLGSRLSAIFTSLDLSQNSNQPHNQKDQAAHKSLHGTHLNARTEPLSSVAKTFTDMSPTHRSSQNPPSEETCVNAKSHMRRNIPNGPAEFSEAAISRKKPKRKPPPPETFNEEPKDHKSASEGFDFLIGSLENELSQLMGSSNQLKASLIKDENNTTRPPPLPGQLDIDSVKNRYTSPSEFGEPQHQFPGASSLAPSYTMLNEPLSAMEDSSNAYCDESEFFGQSKGQQPSRSSLSQPLSKNSFPPNQNSFRTSRSLDSRDSKEKHTMSSPSLSDEVQNHKSFDTFTSVKEDRPLLRGEASSSSSYSNTLSSTKSHLSINVNHRSDTQEAKGFSSPQLLDSHLISIDHHGVPTSQLYLDITSSLEDQPFDEPVPNTKRDISVSDLNQSPRRPNYSYPPRTPLKNTPTLSSMADSSISKALSSSVPNVSSHRKSMSMSSIFSSNSNRHITLATLKKSINLRPGEGQRSNYVQTIRRNAGTAYNDLGPETWKLPVGILPVDKRQLQPTNAGYYRMRLNRKTQSSGVGLKHGHLAPRLLAAEVDESAEGLNKFGSLGRSSTFQRENKDANSITLLKLSLAAISRASSLRQNGGQPSRAASFASSTVSSSSASLVGSNLKKEPTAGYQSLISRQALTSSRVSVGSIRESKFIDGYYQHPGYNFEEEDASDNFSLSTEGTVHRSLDNEETAGEKPRLVLANPDSGSSDEDHL